jgi:NAD+ synthase
MGILPALTEAVPTDGLHTDGATDEDQIGASYDELEWAMPEYDSGKRVQDFSGRAAEVMSIYSKRHEVNAHKMAMPPVFQIHT